MIKPSRSDNTMTELNRWADPATIRIKKQNFSTSDDPKLHPLWICMQDAILHGGEVMFLSEKDLVDSFIRKCKQAYIKYVTPGPPTTINRDRQEEVRIIKVYSGLMDREKNFFARDILESIFITHEGKFSRFPRPEVLELVKSMGEDPPADFLEKIRNTRSEITLGDISLPTPNFSDRKLIGLYTALSAHLESANKLYPQNKVGSMCEYMKFVGVSTRMVNLMKRPDMFEVFDRERDDNATCDFLDEMERVAKELKPIILK